VLRLYSYFRSSASYRVRIALALKGIGFDYAAIHLVNNEQLGESFRALAPSGLVPALRVGVGEGDRDHESDTVLTQSLAIIEYLEETHPEPPLLPKDALGRARVRAIALDMACEIHPLDNLRVLRYLVKEMGVSDDDKNRWYRHWVESGLEVVERRLVGNPATGRFCHGDSPGLADCVLVPQIFNAQRMECRLDHVPTVMRVFESCMAEPAFATSQPSACPDAT
jgi:maleylacetoacetate isomerase